MDKIETMKRFIAVANTGSFTRAAEQMNVPKSAISSSISRLEEHLHTRLLYRSTRQVSLTESGERYLIQSQRLLDELEGLEDQFQSESFTLSGTIRVDMPSRFFSTLIAPNLPDWFARYPNTHIEILGADYRIDPIKERVDCVIRGGKLQDSNLVARALGKMEMINCISPTYAQQFGVPRTLDDLASHYVVDYAADSYQQPNGFEYYAHQESHYVDVPSLISVRTTDAYLAACLNGLGIIQLPKCGVEQQLRNGDLIEVLPEYRCESMSMSVLYESRHQQPRRLSEFIDWLTQVFKAVND
ncbi:LysR family transcriptional regulator [Vibrio sp. CAIM 722]|uniref:LysR family transcriptional regulator n=1 Tax=Vibrio eleionomae TaxID=2653505 RepID=A0A7X4LMM4_9VIBR|nr:LysR family transcriptional regulator [Vibrio eleionomae]MZI94422.1 LysR family transcriptional regulator [Vibrio eleionomae]